MPLTNRRIGTPQKALILFLTVLVSVVLITFEYTNRQSTDSQEPDAELKPTFIPVPTALAPGLYLLGALEPSVAYVVETTEGLILVDTGLEDSHELLVSQFETLGIDLQDLKLILLTHGHGDHYLGALQLQSLTGATLHAGKRDSDVLRNAGPRPAVFSTFPMDHVDIHPTPVDVELSGGETIMLGEARIKVIATPGHTPGSVCYLLEHHGLRMLFSGDTIMTMTGDLGTYATYLSPRYRGDAEEYLATLQQLQKLAVPDLLLPGHPETNQGTISARISPQQWSSLLSRGLRQMEELTARYATDGRDFLDGDPKELISGLHYLGDYSGTAVYCFEKDSSVILVDAPGGAEFVEFLQERLEAVELELSMLVAIVLTRADSESVRGLSTLIKRTNCRIIAGQSNRELIRSLNPDAVVLTPETAATEFDWLSLQPIAVDGFDRTRMVYEIVWEGKRVLLTGQVPLKLTREAAQDLRDASFRPRDFEPSLIQIRQVQPDLWLPGSPVNGQNANLYGSEWRDIHSELQLTFGFGMF